MRLLLVFVYIYFFGFVSLVLFFIIRILIGIRSEMG